MPPSFLRTYLKKLPFHFLLLLAFFGGSIFLFAYVAHEVIAEQEEQFDQAVFVFLSAHVINSSLTAAMKTVTYFASATFLQIAYGATIACYLLARKWKRALEIVAIGIGGFVVNYLMKISFHRIRPPNPLAGPLHNFSFPSGHATSGFIFYGLLVYLLWKTPLAKPWKYLAGIVLIAFSLLIGFSRVYLRLHYATDVIAGFCTGFAWLLLCVWTLDKLKKSSAKKVNASV